MPIKFLYAAIELTSEGKEALLTRAKLLDLEELKNVYLHHCTLQYGKDTLIDNNLVGSPTIMKVTGYLEEKGMCSCFIVEHSLPTDRVSHITFTTNEGIPPSYSNTLITRRKIKPLFPAIYLTGIIKKYFVDETSLNVKEKLKN